MIAPRAELLGRATRPPAQLRLRVGDGGVIARRLLALLDAGRLDLVKAELLALTAPGSSCTRGVS